ncbi:LysR family transcriptional regulator [Pseudomonas sichuanensis]
MDIRHLKAFIAVFEERNITLAAQRLCVAQPTLSVTIRQLEDDLGAELFVRQARGVEVTEQARALYAQACRMVAEAEALRRRFRQGREQVPLTLGVEADIAPAQVEACVRLANQAVERLQLTLLEGCAGDARLADEEQRCEDELFLPLWEEAFVLVSATGSQPDGRWISCPQHPSHQRLMAAYGEGKQVGQAASLQQALAMVAAGLGTAWLPQSLAERHPGVYWQPGPGLALRRRIGLCLTREALALPALASLHQALGGG